MGYISLNQALNNDEVLAVAFQYTIGNNTYQVGEFTNSGPTAPQSLIVKLLKGTNFSPNYPNWHLMMKNIYALGAYQMSSNGFILDVVYENTEESGALTNYIPEGNLEGIPLIKIINVDQLNQQMDNQSDGVFDFVPIQFNGNRAENGGTINTRNGRVYFSTIEPFGQTLADKLSDAGVSDVIIDRVAYTELYDSTKTAAQQIPSKNRFSFKGEYESSITSDIPLNALNVPEGAVTVTAGGLRLIEGVDYTVDYNLGRVKILNTGI